MNAKLTLSLDKDVIERAKVYAGAHNVSLSSLVENILLKIVSDYKAIDEGPGSIVKELSGIIDLEGVDYKKAYLKHLEEKHR